MPASDEKEKVKHQFSTPRRRVNYQGVIESVPKAGRWRVRFPSACQQVGGVFVFRFFFFNRQCRYPLRVKLLNYLAVEPRGFLLHRQRLAEPLSSAAAVVSTGIGPGPSTAVPSVEPFPAPGERL